MKRLVIQTLRDHFRTYLVEDEGAVRVQRGPVTPRPAGIRAETPDAWRQVVEPIERFAAGQRASVCEIVVLPTEVEAFLISARAVPGMTPEEAVRARLHIDWGIDPDQDPVLWRPLARRKGVETDWWDACVLRTDALSVVVARRISELVGEKRIRGRVLPYPLAAVRAAQRLRSVSDIRGTAVVDVGMNASRLTVCHSGAPLFTAVGTFSGRVLEERILTPVSVHSGKTKRLTPDQAEMLLEEIDLSEIESRLGRETDPVRRQVLQWVQIEVERFVREIADELRRAHDERGIEPTTGAIYCERKFVGLDALLARTTGLPWTTLTPEEPEEAESTCALRPPLFAYGLSEPPEEQGAWKWLSDRAADRPRWWTVSQALLGAALAACVGVLAGIFIDTIRLNLEAVRAEEKAADSAIKTEAVRTLQRLSARARQMEAIIEPQILRRDRLVRRFLLGLTRFQSKNFVLDSVLVDAGDRRDAAPVAALRGRAGAADRELQRFMLFLGQRPEVERTVLDDVSAGDDPVLRCRFSLTVVLKRPNE